MDVSTGGDVIRWHEEAKLGTQRVRQYWAVTGVAGRVRYGVHNNSYTNLRRGLIERVLYRVRDGISTSPPKPTPGVFEDELSKFRQELVACTSYGPPLTRQQFVDCYDGRKRSVYQAAADSLASRPLLSKDSMLSTFVKCEKLDFDKLITGAPRVIQPRNPRYNVELGRYLKKMEHNIVKGIAEVFGAPTVFKGMNAREAGSAMRGHWDEFVEPVGIGIDATRFDQHVSVDALKFEHSVYLALVPKSRRRRLRALLRRQLLNEGVARTDEGVIKYAVEGRRMSGDMNTGMGNCLLMSAMVWGLARHCGVRLRLANNGDDCMLICERKFAARLREAIPAWFLKFGFVMEVEPTVDVFEQMEFCQTRPVWADGWVMCRDIRKCVSKDLVSSLDLGTGGAKWAHAIGQGGLALSSGVPCLQELYSTLLRHGKPGKTANHPWLDNGFARMARGLESKTRPISDEARVSFWRAFGIVPDMQIALENEWRSMAIVLSAGVTESSVAPFFDLLT